MHLLALSTFVVVFVIAATQKPCVPTTSTDTTPAPGTTENPCKGAYKVKYLKLKSKYPNCIINVGECDTKVTCGERCDKPCVPVTGTKRQWCGPKHKEKLNSSIQKVSLSCY